MLDDRILLFNIDIYSVKCINQVEKWSFYVFLHVKNSISSADFHSVNVFLKLIEIGCFCCTAFALIGKT